MFRTMSLGLLVCSLLVNFAPAQPSTLLDSNYQKEVYFQFTNIVNDRPASMDFDQAGNLYITYQNSGTVAKIDPLKNRTTFASGFINPTHCLWGGGTGYGNNLYVSDIGADRVYQVDASGAKTLFTTVKQPDGLGLDRVGNYGGALYVGTTALDHIDSVAPSGSRTLFSDFPYDQTGCTGTIDFDPGTAYGGQMYVATLSTSGGAWSGIYRLDNAGTPSIFCSNLALAGKVEFDQSGEFGNHLFALGMFTVNQPYWSIYRVSPEGVATDFYHNFAGSFTFFGDNMYVADYNGATFTTTIYEISAVPEPGMLVLLALGAVRLSRRRGH